MDTFPHTHLRSSFHPQQMLPPPSREATPHGRLCRPNPPLCHPQYVRAAVSFSGDVIPFHVLFSRPFCTSLVSPGSFFTSNFHLALQSPPQRPLRLIHTTHPVSWPQAVGVPSSAPLSPPSPISCAGISSKSIEELRRIEFIYIYIYIYICQPYWSVQH
jgi:hypothetical protein